MSVKKNFSYQLGYELIVLICPLLISPYVSRVLGAEGIGQYSFSSTSAQYFVLFAMLGIRNYGSRLMARSRDSAETLNQAFSSLLADHLLLSIAACLAYALYCRACGGTDRLCALYQWPLVISAAFDISWFYYGIERFKVSSGLGSAVKLLSTALVFVLVRSPEDVGRYCLLMAASVLAGQLVLWLPLHRYVKIVRPKKAEMLLHLKPLLVLFIPAVAVSIYKYMDKLMIGILSDKTQLGYFQNADTAVGTTLLVVDAFGGVMLPRMAHLAGSRDRAEAERYLSRSMQYVMGLAFAIAFGLTSVAGVFAVTLWGPEFALSGELIRALAVTVPFIAFSNVIRTQFLLPNNRDRDFVASVSIGALCNLVINYCLIPEYGAAGATLGTVVTEIVVCLVQVWAVRRDLPLGKYLVSAIPFLLSGACMYAAVTAVAFGRSPSLRLLCLQIVSGVAVFAVLSGIYLYCKKDPLCMSALSKANECLHSKRVRHAVLWLVLFAELFLAVPYEYLTTLPAVNKAIYVLQAAAVFAELLYAAIRFFKAGGGLKERLKGLLRFYNPVSALLAVFVLYNWVVTVVLKSEPFVTSMHYPVQLLILVLAVSRTFREDERLAISAIAAFFWVTIMANTVVYLRWPGGLYTNVSAVYYYHTCYLLGVPNQFGKMYLAGFALLWFYEDRYRKTYFLTLSSLYAMVYFYFTCAFSTSTGKIVIAMLLALILVYNIKWLRPLLCMEVFLAAIAVAAVSIISQKGILFSDGPIRNTILKVVGDDVTFSGRTPIWSLAWEKIQGSPVFGYGRVIDNAQVPLYDTALSAHNQILQVLLDGGFIGLCTFLFPFLFTTVKGFRAKRRHPELRILYIGVFVSLTYFMFEVGTMLPMFLCLLAACLCGEKWMEQEKAPAIQGEAEPANGLEQTAPSDQESVSARTELQVEEPQPEELQAKKPQQKQPQNGRKTKGRKKNRKRKH